MSNATRFRRLPLRDLLTHTDRRCRELLEHLQMDLGPSVGELHGLSRPKRRKSSFPAVRTVFNNFDKVRRALDHARQLHAEIEECVRTLEERAGELQR